MTMRKIILGLLALLAIGSTVGDAQQTLPPNVVVGRLGIGPGPSQAIPFATLNSVLSTPGLIVTNFGAVCDGTTDDTAAIQSAINALPNDGGIVLFPAKNCKITSTITIGNGTASAVSTKKGVVLKGLAQPGVTGSPFFNGYAAITGPKLTWAGGTGSSMISISGPLKGWGIQNLFLDCASVASMTGLNVSSAGYGDSSNLSIANCPGAGISSNANPLGGYSGAITNADSIRNNWTTIDVDVPAVVGAKGILLNGDPGGTSNTDYNTFTNVFIRLNGNANPNYGLYLGVSDSNVFNSLNISGGGANSVNIALDYSINSQFPNGNIIVGVDSNGTGTQWQNIGSPANQINNYALGISQANGGTFPSLQNLSVFASSEVVLAGTTSGRAAVVPQAVAGTPTLTLPTTTGTFQTALPAPLTANTTTGVAAWSGMTSNGILYAGSATTVATDRCTMDSNQSTSCTSATAFAPQGIFTNTTSDANSSSFIFNKNRSAGNTNSGDQIGSFIFRGFANTAQQNAALITATQTAASSGSNIPSAVRVTTSNAAGQLNQQLTFDQNAHLAITAQATAPSISAGCNGAGSSVGTGSSDYAGNITGQTAAATTCTITFGTAFGNTPSCVTSGDQSAILTQVRATGTLVVTFASTANYRFNWVCSGV